jgi:hypothetical protein
MDPTSSIQAVTEAATKIDNNFSLLAFLASIALIFIIVLVGIVLRALMKMNAETRERVDTRNKQINDFAIAQATVTANLAACTDTLNRVNLSLDELYGSRLSHQNSISSLTATQSAHDAMLKDHGQRIGSLERRN